MDTTVFLQQLFSSEPARLGETYIESAIHDIRYSVADSSKFSIKKARMPAEAPDWLRDDSKLGPYEKEIFSDILTTNECLFVMRGGSGSGKSSLAYALEERADILTLSKKNCDSWRERSGYSTFFLRIDLQAAIDYSIDNWSTVPRTPQLDSGFLNWITDCFLQCCFNQLPSSPEFLADLINFFCNDENNSHSYMETFKDRLSDRLDAALDGRPSTFTNHWRKASKKWMTPAQQVNATVCFLASCARRLRQLDAFQSEDWGKSQNIIVCLDNTDRVRPDLLRMLLLQLQTLFEQDQYSKSGLKFMFFMRLSTSRDVIGALPKISVRQFASPDPQDLVIPKIVGFLYNNEHISKSFGKTVVNDAKYRLLEFIIRMSDPFDKLYELLFSFSGTNVRLFYGQLIKLITAPNFRPRISNETEFGAYLPRVNGFVGDVTLLRLGIKAASALSDVIEANAEIDHASLDKVVDDVAVDITDSVFSLLKSQDQAGFHLRGRFYDNSGLANLVEGRFLPIKGTNESHPFTDIIFDRVLSGALKSPVEKVHQLRFINGARKPDIVRKFLNLLPERCRALAEKKYRESPYSPDFIEEYVRSFAMKLLKLSKTKHFDEAMVFERSRFRLLMPQVASGSSGETGFPPQIQTRYALTKILLGRTATQTGSDELPVNIFSSSMTEFAPIPLKVLYIIPDTMSALDAPYGPNARSQHFGNSRAMEMKPNSNAWRPALRQNPSCKTSAAKPSSTRSEPSNNG